MCWRGVVIESGVLRIRMMVYSHLSVMCVHTISHNLFQGVDVEPGTWQGLAASPFFQVKPHRVWLLASGWVLRLWFPSNKGLGRAAELGKRKRGALRHFIQT